MIENDEQDPGFFQRHRLLVTVGALALFVGAGIAWKTIRPVPETKRNPGTVVFYVPQQTPPPVKPVPTPHSLATPRSTPFIAASSPAPTDPGTPPKGHPAETPGTISTNIPGPNGPLGLDGSGPGIGGQGTDDGPIGKYYAFSRLVEARIAEVLRANARTRTASLNITVRLWPDASGRIAKVRLADGTGDASLDRLIQDQILTGLQLASPPPADMPLPIVMSVSARRP